MLEDLKLLLGLEDTDKKTEQQLQLILNATKQRLKFLLGGLEPPEEMEYIILDVSVIRFNRIGSEGLSSHSVEGESLSWSENDFAGYMDDIQSYLDSQREAMAVFTAVTQGILVAGLSNYVNQIVKQTQKLE